jgi:chromosomal replication initiation ATPase DnaA
VERPQTDNDRIKAALWNARGPDIYDAWFSGLDCKIVDGVARVLIPTKLKRSTIAEKFEKDVLAAVRLVSEGVTSLELVTAPDTMVGALGRKTGRSGGACIETPPGPAGSCFARPQSS